MNTDFERACRTGERMLAFGLVVVVFITVVLLTCCGCASLTTRQPKGTLIGDANRATVSVAAQTVKVLHETDQLVQTAQVVAADSGRMVTAVGEQLALASGQVKTATAELAQAILSVLRQLLWMAYALSGAGVLALLALAWKWVRA
jgi:hypothetical protein